MLPIRHDGGNVPGMILAVLLVCVLLSLVSGLLGLFAVPRAEPVYMGVCTLSSAAAVVVIVVGYLMQVPAA